LIISETGHPIQFIFGSVGFRDQEMERRYFRLDEIHPRSRNRPY